MTFICFLRCWSLKAGAVFGNGVLLPEEGDLISISMISNCGKSQVSRFLTLSKCVLSLHTLLVLLAAVTWLFLIKSLALLTGPKSRSLPAWLIQGPILFPTSNVRILQLLLSCVSDTMKKPKC